MKKVVSVLLCAVLMLACAIPVFADGVTAINTPSSASVKRGDNVTITISLSQAVTSQQFSVDFYKPSTTEYIWDTSVFEWVSGQWLIESRQGALMTLPLVTVNEGNAAFLETLMPAGNTLSPLEVSGDVFSFTLKVKDDAAFGVYSFGALMGTSVNDIFALQEASITVTHDHTYGTGYEKDETGHWQLCTIEGCPDNDNPTKAQHVYDNDCDTTCNVCGYERSITHTPAETWTTDATNHWKVCSVCGTKLSETEAAHSGGTATCQAKAQCSVCGAEYGDFASHNFVENTDAKFLKSAANCTSAAVYFKSCSVCGLKSDETFTFGEKDPDNHVGEFSWEVTTPATTEAEGLKTGTCSACGGTKTEKIAKLATEVTVESDKAPEGTAVKLADGTAR